jgi:hypothetical protein
MWGINAIPRQGSAASSYAVDTVIPECIDIHERHHLTGLFGLEEST